VSRGADKAPARWQQDEVKVAAGDPLVQRRIGALNEHLERHLFGDRPQAGVRLSQLLSRRISDDLVVVPYRHAAALAARSGGLRRDIDNGQLRRLVLGELTSQIESCRRAPSGLAESQHPPGRPGYRTVRHHHHLPECNTFTTPAIQRAPNRLYSTVEPDKLVEGIFSRNLSRPCRTPRTLILQCCRIEDAA
jgi:hypothetical protein